MKIRFTKISVLLAIFLWATNNADMRSLQADLEVAEGGRLLRRSEAEN